MESEMLQTCWVKCQSPHVNSKSVGVRPCRVLRPQVAAYADIRRYDCAEENFRFLAPWSGSPWNGSTAWYNMKMLFLIPSRHSSCSQKTFLIPNQQFWYVSMLLGARREGWTSKWNTSRMPHSVAWWRILSCMLGLISVMLICSCALPFLPSTISSAFMT